MTTIPHIDISPAGCAARKARIEAAVAARLVREQKLSDARALTRSALIVNAWELFAAAVNIVASVRTTEPLAKDYARKMQQVLDEMDAELRGDPELLAGSERGEYDTYTQGVRNWSAA